MRLLLPGYCDGDLSPLRRITDLPIEIGPRDLHALPQFFGETAQQREDYGSFSIQILAEINHAPRRSLDEILAAAHQLARDGAHDAAVVWQFINETPSRTRRSR